MNRKYGKGLIKNFQMRFCWRIFENLKGKFYNVFIFCVLKMRSRRTAFLKKMANITIFSLNIVENSVNILEKVL